jgi:hypothetical protein
MPKRAARLNQLSICAEDPGAEVILGEPQAAAMENPRQCSARRSRKDGD